ncbi:MAG: SIMPL domain-containing protein [Chloroflexi bacterium]|nr:SIMPL domain-containing protein [Chloroflexota bacterium]
MNTKSIILTAVALTLVLLTAGYIVNQPVIREVSASTANPPCPDEPRTISVTGDAGIRVAPDEVIITLGIETWNEDLNKAKSENDERVKQVLALADDFDIEPRYIQTDHISIEPRYEDWYEKQDFIGFNVRKSIVITLRDIDKFEDLITSALEGGVNRIHGIQFRTTELRKHKDEARSLAIKAAEEKAIALAGELGQEIGKPQHINESHSGWWSWYGSYWGSYWSGPMAQNVIQEVGSGSSSLDGTMAPGQITVNAKISVTFELK